MRLIKMFGLAAIAAVSAMAFIGVSSASADKDTALCKISELPCATGNQWKSGETFHALATNPLLHTSIVDVKCEYSLTKSESLGLAKAPTRLEVHVELTWIGCKTHGGTNCTVTTVLQPLLLVLKLSSTDAHVESDGKGAVLVKCGENLHCIYSGNPVLLAEGSPAILHANTLVKETAAHGTKIICPNESRWLALYEALANESVYISS